MSDDLEYLFGQLRTVAQAAALADPADIRRTGQRRAKLRRGVAAVAVAVAVAVAGGGLVAYGSSGSHVSPGPPPGPAPSWSDSGRATERPDRTGTPTPSAVTPSTQTSHLPPRAAGADCRPADLDPLPYYGSDGAMGTQYTVIVVQNVSPTRCRLYGHPTVRYTDRTTGRSGTVPMIREATASPVMLQPGQWAEVTISMANGNPYGPGATQCAQPRSYQGLSLVIGDELPYALPGEKLSWDCGDSFIRPWASAPNGPNGIAATVVRAHKP